MCAEKYSKPNVLLVEDDVVLASILTSIFYEFDAEVVAVSTAREGVGLLGCHDWAVIMTDVRTPGGVSGFELAQQAELQCPKAIVIVSSGYYDSSEMLTLERALFFSKPWDLEALMNALGLAFTLGSN